MAIPIVVQECAAGSPASYRAEQAGFASDVCECPIAVVAIENILSPISEEQIVKAIVVVVTDANAACPAGFSQAGVYRHIMKGAVAIIAIEPIGDARVKTGERTSPQHQDVDPSIVVVVQKC